MNHRNNKANKLNTRQIHFGLVKRLAGMLLSGYRGLQAHVRHADHQDARNMPEQNAQLASDENTRKDTKKA